MSFDALFYRVVFCLRGAADVSPCFGCHDSCLLRERSCGMRWRGRAPSRRTARPQTEAGNATERKETAGLHETRLIAGRLGSDSRPRSGLSAVARMFRPRKKGPGSSIRQGGSKEKETGIVHEARWEVDCSDWQINTRRSEVIGLPWIGLFLFSLPAGFFETSYRHCQTPRPSLPY
jgi:hypothetical protein